MRRLCTAFILFFLLLCATCEQFFPSRDPADGGVAKEGNFTVDLRRISLNASELGTVPGLNPTLRLAKFPEFASPERATVVWSSSDPSVATIDPDTGAITVRTTPVTEPLTTMIRVVAVHDASIYAFCSLTVFPVYPTRRRWNFPVHPTNGANNTLIPGDNDMGNGGTILQATGGGGGYDRQGEGIHDIDPEDPYKYGLTPNGGPRDGLNWAEDTSSPVVRPAFYRAEANYFGIHAAEPDASTTHLRTGGSARFFRIAALQGPFTVIVNYMSNGTAGAHADIRIGDKEGIRVEGEGSEGTGAGDGKIVKYDYDGKDFVPFVYLESDTGLRVYDIYVLGENRFLAVPDTFDITGDGTITVGNEPTYRTSIASATDPTYEWEITAGTDCAQIVGSNTGATVDLKATAVGQFDLTVKVSTTNPDLPATDPNKVKEVTVSRTIDVVYIPIETVTIGGPDTVEATNTIRLTTNLTPANATLPEYLWEFTAGDANGAISGATTDATAAFLGVAEGSVTVKVTVTTTNPADPADKTSISAEKTITVAPEPPYISWRFNAETAAAAGLTGSGTITIPAGRTDFGRGLFLLRNEIRTGQASSGISPQITGCMHMSGSGAWGELSGITGSFKIEIIYGNTGSGNDDRWPTITIGSIPTQLKGASTASTIDATTGSATLSGNGSAMTLNASGNIRVFEIKVIPQ